MSLEANNPQSEKLLLKAHDQGINYFDTADLYQQGLNETLLGRAFRHIRNRVIIGTKGGNQWQPGLPGWEWNPSKKYLLSAVDQSLRRLQTDYIDLYQLHGGTLEDPIDEMIETLEWLRSAGKIRFYGISSIRPNVIREYVRKSSMISVMMQYSLLDRRPEDEIFSLLLENQIGVLARGTIARGLLVSKAPEAYLNYSSQQAGLAADLVRQVSGPHQSAFDTALQFALMQPAVTAAVVGIRTDQQLNEALASANGTGLTDEQMQILRAALPINHYTDHR